MMPYVGVTSSNVIPQVLASCLETGHRFARFVSLGLQNNMRQLSQLNCLIVHVCGYYFILF